jgi:ADP-heptose:LPS heptosyltransferase
MPDSLFKAQHLIQKINAKQALLFTNNLWGAVIMRFAGKQVIGYQNPFRNFLLKKTMAKKSNLHEVEYFWEIAKLAAETWQPDTTWPQSIPQHINLPINTNNENHIKQILEQHHITRPFIALCPLATGLTKQGESKIWPFWNELSQQLAQQNISVVACPGPGEEALCRQLVPEAKIISKLNLHELATLFKQANLIIANDSGPMHLAAAVGSPVLGIFGTTDPSRTFPWGGAYLGERGLWPSIDQVLEHVYNPLFSIESSSCLKI